MTALIQRQVERCQVVIGFLHLLAVLLFLDDQQNIDPVCGMDGTGKKFTSSYSAPYFRKTYCFCSAECKAQFDQDPEEYLE